MSGGLVAAIFSTIAAQPPLLTIVKMVAAIRPTAATTICTKSVTVTAHMPPKAVKPIKKAAAMIEQVVSEPKPREAMTLPAEVT